MIGKTVSHYTLIEKLGGGGMGVVYKARDLKLDRFIALKFLPHDLKRDDEIKERFIHEAKAASALQHNNICTIHEINETDDGQIFICMDCYEGETLKDKMKDERIKIKDVINIAIQIARGLEKAHQKGIVHRDIKPANIFITEEGVVKLLDFGLAKLAGRTMLTKAGTTVGTVAYMSPEQTKGEEVDFRTDLWSLGVILYEMITGRLPFKGDYEQAVIYSIINEEPASLKDKLDVHPEIAEIVNRLLQKDPRSRYTSADELIHDLEAYQKKETDADTEAPDVKSFIRYILKPRIAVPVIAAIILLSIIVLWFFDRRAKIRWANDQALPEIEKQVNSMNYIDAFTLLQKAEKYIAENPDFRKWAALVKTRLTILTDPPGADIYLRLYEDQEGEWQKVGKTPIDSINLPDHTFYLMKIEKAGYENVLAVAATNFDTLFRKLLPEGTIPPDMVYVEGYGDELTGNFLKEKNGFFIDRYEVTNKQYKEFVDNGGYRNSEYWEYEFFKDGRILTWEEAIAEFTDKTGRPGPATWEASNYTAGEDDYPVSGVNWYEAAAYAAYAGKSLPTANHWDCAAGINLDYLYYYFGEAIKPSSNFSGKGSEPVGKSPGISLFGAYDMAGNVREWCWNRTEEGRIIAGGAWNDAAYLYELWSQLPPFDRSPENGFRCIKYVNKEKIPASAFQLIELGDTMDYSQDESVPEHIFRIYKNQFRYDKTDLDAKIEARDDSPADWIIERITFNAAYGNERVSAYLYLPENAEPPYQTLIFFPGSYAENRKENLVNQRHTNWFFDYLLKNGCAVLYPVYKGTFERSNGLDWSYRSHQYTELLITWVKDVSRSIDYLESRSDIDNHKIGYYGHSWGGELGGIIPAVEERLRVNILIVGGFVGRPYPEAAQINYVPRIKIPTLMLNGKYDAIFPYETSVKPFFDLLAAPEGDKRLCLYETGHFVPKGEMIKETLNWLDQYFGPPNIK
jgi:serine/threonine protein kinase/dienelactone hydrolase